MKEKKIKSQRLPKNYALYNKIDRLPVNDISKIIIKELFNYAYTTYGISEEDLNTRKRRVVDTNCIIVTVISEQFRNLSLEKIGGLINKHHATVIHYKDNYQNILCLDSNLRDLYDTLHNKCNMKKYGWTYETIINFKKETKESLKLKVLSLSSELEEYKIRLHKIKEQIKI